MNGLRPNFVESWTVVLLSLLSKGEISYKDTCLGTEWLGNCYIEAKY